METPVGGCAPDLTRQVFLVAFGYPDGPDVAVVAELDCTVTTRNGAIRADGFPLEIDTLRWAPRATS